MSTPTDAGRVPGPLVPVPGAPSEDLRAASDPIAEASACSTRTVEREGVPVVLAVLDARTAPQDRPAPGADTDPTGGALADLVDAYRAALVPESADDDADALYAVLELVGWSHVRAGTGPHRDGAP